MRSSVAAVHEIVTRLEPLDETEAGHRAQVLAWLTGTDDIFRRTKPATPPMHLVSYVVPVDPADGSILLVDHINARLWLPPGGHVEPDEHPAATAARELTEELGLTTTPAADPLFLTVTRTVGADAGHTDVSLWYVVHCGAAEPLSPDAGEFHSVRWWSPADLDQVDPGGFDPHFARFRRKLPTVG
jgi:8-oxo-dGTP diphosphatase